MLEPSPYCLLIDAETISCTGFDHTLALLQKDFGRLSVRRIYGDWAAPSLSGGVQAIKNHALRPIYQFNDAQGKTAVGF